MPKLTSTGMTGNTFPTPDAFCPGCGYYPVVTNGEHRDDCTLEKESP